jgi:hypothetical protein
LFNCNAAALYKFSDTDYKPVVHVFSAIILGLNIMNAILICFWEQRSTQLKLKHGRVPIPLRRRIINTDDASVETGEMNHLRVPIAEIGNNAEAENNNSTNSNNSNNAETTRKTRKTTVTFQI